MGQGGVRAGVQAVDHAVAVTVQVAAVLAHLGALGRLGAAVGPVGHAVPVAVTLAVTDGEHQVVDIAAIEGDGVVAPHPFAGAVGLVVEDLEVRGEDPCIDEAGEVVGGVPKAVVALRGRGLVGIGEGEDPLGVADDLFLEAAGVHHREVALAEMQYVGVGRGLVVPVVVVGEDIEEVVRFQLLGDMEVVAAPVGEHGAVEHIVAAVVAEVDDGLAGDLASFVGPGQGRQAHQQGEGDLRDEGFLAGVAHGGLPYGFRTEKIIGN